MFVLFRQCPTHMSHTVTQDTSHSKSVRRFRKISPQYKHLCFWKHHRYSLSVPRKLAIFYRKVVGHALTWETWSFVFDCASQSEQSTCWVHGRLCSLQFNRRRGGRWSPLLLMLEPCSLHSPYTEGIAQSFMCDEAAACCRTRVLLVVAQNLTQEVDVARGQA